MRALRSCPAMRRFPVMAKLAVAVAFAPLILQAAETAPGTAKHPAFRCPPVFVAKCAPGKRPVCVRREGRCCARAQCEPR